MMKLYQLDWIRARELGDDQLFRMMSGFDAGQAADREYASAFESGLYDHVADAEGSDLDRLFSSTNNGVVSESWSRSPPQGIYPLRPASDLRSTSIGDVVELDGRLHVVAIAGFRDIGPAPLPTAAPAA